MKILFLSANPTDTFRLRLDEESREIEKALHQTPQGRSFDFEKVYAVRVNDIQYYLHEIQPNIIHFSGHGTNNNEILVLDQFGKSHPITLRAIDRLFANFNQNILCVILNACYSEEQAAAIAKHVDYVVGMSDEITDKAAISFVTAFYQALGRV